MTYLAARMERAAVLGGLKGQVGEELGEDRA